MALRVVAACMIAAPASSALAYCSEPDAPSSYAKPRKPTPPTRPYCAATRSCSDWEVSSYNSQLQTYQHELDRYEAAVQRYVRQLKDYVDEALEYAKCEIRDLED